MMGRVSARVILAVALMLLALLAGCVVAQTSGQKLATTDKAIDRMAVLVQYANFSEGNSAALAGNRDVEQLFPHLAERLPAVFALNRIQSRAVFVAADARVPAELDGFRHLLRVWPQAASYSTRSGSTLTVGAELVDRSQGQVVWRGSILFGTMGYGKYDAALADELAGKLLGQLRHDGVIQLRTAAPVLKAPPAVAGAASVPAPVPTPAEDVYGDGPAPENAAAAAPKVHRKQLPPASGFAAIDNVDAVPVRPEGKDRYRHFLTLPAPKAFIVYDTGGWRFWSNDRNAMTNALDSCARDGKVCWLYAVDDRVVWQADVDKRIGRSAQLLDR